MKAKFISNRRDFDHKNRAFIDMVQGRMAMHIETNIKTSAGTPVKTGGMKAEVRHFKTADGRWRVEADKGYSAYQERGARADGSHRVRHYTTAGTSAGWFKRAIDSVIAHRAQYIEEAKKAVGL